MLEGVRKLTIPRNSRSKVSWNEVKVNEITNKAGMAGREQTIL